MINIKLNDLIKRFGTPLYVYDKNKIIQNYSLIKNHIPYHNKQIHYAVMCNNHPKVLETIRDLGGCVQINSLPELGLAKKTGFKHSRISFTSTGLDTSSLEKLVQENVQINLDSIEEVKKYCRLNQNGNFGIRIKIREDIKLPEGHTNSPKNSDIGICAEYFDKVKKISEQHDCKINGIHGYLASNILASEPFIQFSDYLIECAKQFPDIEYVNFGSGFGVLDKQEEQKLNFEMIGQYYSKLMHELSIYFKKNIQLKIEPGRSIMATAGTLYAKVTNIKKLDGKKQISIDAGFGEFARTMIYNIYHDIEVVDKQYNITLYDVRANTVLQSDFLAKDILLPNVKEGDIIAIKNAGAYGHVMASGFPGKKMPKLIMI